MAIRQDLQELLDKGVIERNTKRKKEKRTKKKKNR